MKFERRVTTQDISWFLDHANNNQLDMDPPYQRRSVWSPKDRRFFLDTIFRGYPSPSIFLHKDIIGGKTIYAVVDGKQRLETILKFVENKIAIDKDYGDVRLAGQKWKTIKKDEKLARTFWDYVLPVEFTNITEDTNIVKEVFDRLNRNSRRLTEQELRHAKYEGWFSTFVELESEQLEWQMLGVVTTARAKRMKDTQFISELLIVVMKDGVSGFDQEEITGYYAKYDNLADLEIPFDEEKIKEKFRRTKTYLLEMEGKGSVVSQYAKDFNNFYSLWAVVSSNIERLPDVEEFAGKYSEFMDSVGKFKDEEYRRMFIEKGEVESSMSSYEYYENSIGASTEPPQRQQRSQVLEKILF